MVCKIFLTLDGGQKMPALGYGTWQAANDSLEKPLEVALETGYRHIDTAQSYENEHIIGKVLQRWFDSGKLKREDVFITTKLSAHGMHPDTVEAHTKESLEKLQLLYVDLYLIHLPFSIVTDDNGFKADPDVHYLDVWKKMEDQYLAGRAKAIGVSNFRKDQIERILEECRVKPANLQVEMHVNFQQKELFDFCKKNGITMTAYAPIGASGFNKVLEQVGIPPRELPNLFQNAVVLAIAKKHKKTAAQVLIRFLLQMGVAPIPKSVTPARVKENFNVANFFLDVDDMNKLKGLDGGSSARIYDFKDFGERVTKHPEFLC